jgi:DNA-binding SARP family transcriptional activator
MPEFRILGPIEVIGDDGAPVQMAGMKPRAALAFLLLRANELVPRESLVTALWGETPPRTVKTSLQNAIVMLRRVLGPDVLVTQPPGYRLAVDPETVDLYRFERLVVSARSLEASERVAALTEGLALWHGEPLADIAFEPFAAAEIRRLEELRVVATEELIAAELDAGHASEVVPTLESLVARHPLRERLRSQLMLALYRSGRQADALIAYQDARAALLEVGLEPGPQLQELQQSILRQDVSIHPTAARASPQEHIEQVASTLLEGALVPVLGTDVGALASHLAERFDYPVADPPDLARVAQYVALTKGSGPLYDELHALLAGSGAPSPVHRFFASLPPLLRERGQPHMLLVTTSYDLSLEQALLEAGEEFDVVYYVAFGRERGRFRHIEPDGDAHVIDLPNRYATQLSLERRTVVLKLHGGVDQSPARSRESFVITEDDYIDYFPYGDLGAAIPVALAAKLRRSHFLFLGYGMRDWNLRLVLGRIWGAEGLSYRSWAVQPDPRPLERDFWAARHVELLEAGLAEYVTGLGRYLGVTQDVAA